VARPGKDHYRLVANRILEGRVSPFLGAGVNLCERPEKTPWQLGVYLPNADELAHALAVKSLYPDKKDVDLLRVSQWMDAILGEGALYEYLRSLFDADYPPNSVHRLLAGIPSAMKAKGAQPAHQLILTTNYDDALERAFDEKGEKYDLVWYEAKKKRGLCGKFVHRPPGEEPRPIDVPNEYADLSLDERTVILKLHGAVDRADSARDSYVITEDNYIDYMVQSDISGQIPKTLREYMEDSHFLFLGYSMGDWNLRVILNRIWGAQQLDLKSWSVQKKHAKAQWNKIEQRLWSDRGNVDLLYVPLKQYVDGLGEQVFAPAATVAGV